VLLSGGTFPHAPALLACLLVPPVVAIVLGLRPAGRTSAGRLAMAGLLTGLGAASLLQYGDFYADYMTDYRERLVVETDGNMRGVLETVIALSPPPQPSQPLTWIYLGFRLGPADWGGNYWRFYVHKHRREDLLVRTVNDENAARFNRAFLCQMPPGSLVTTRIGWDSATDALIDQMTTKGELVRAGAIGWPVYVMLRTTPSCGAA
jgi:hypothetical protein